MTTHPQHLLRPATPKRPSCLLTCSILGFFNGGAPSAAAAVLLLVLDAVVLLAAGSVPELQGRPRSNERQRGEEQQRGDSVLDIVCE
jgi:hypothetical protein